MSPEPVSNDSVTDIIKKFQNHPSIIKIKEKTIKGILFYSCLQGIHVSKAIQWHDIPVKIIKANGDIFSEFIMHNFNEGISSARCPDILKNAEVKPVF